MLGELTLALMLQLTAPVKNPTKVLIVCPDHDQDNEHEIDIIDTNGTVVQTLLGGDPARDANGDVPFLINVQPVKFGIYTVKVRAVSVGLKGEDSLPSNLWERVPGAPGTPKVTKE